MCSPGINDPQVGDYMTRAETRIGPEAAPRLDLVMRAVEANVHLVRSLVNDGAEKWSLPSSVQLDSALVLTELVTNVIRIYPGSRCRVWISNPPGSLALDLSVWDRDPTRWPIMGYPDLEAQKGRGLPLVHALTKGRWSWYPLYDPDGKVVTARVSP
jgi:hypothetical protein